MRSKQASDGVTHGLQIKLRMKPAHSAIEKHVAHRPVMKNVAIASGSSGKARMKVVTKLPRPGHCNALRQMGIHAPHPRCFGADRVAIEMPHLHRGVNPGISPPSALNLDALPRDRRYSCSQTILHRAPMRLSLPAFKSSATVFDAQCYPCQHHTPNKTNTNTSQKPSRKDKSACSSNNDRVSADSPCA